MTQEPSRLAAGDAGRRYWMSEHSIVLAVIEIRYDSGRSSIDQEAALAVRDALRAAGYDFGQINKSVKGEITLAFRNGEAEASSTSEVQGWELVDATRHLNVTIAPDRLAVQTQRYTHYSETFKPLLAPLLESVAQVVEPGLRRRVGLRYVNRIADLEVREPGEWRGRVSDWLLGPVSAGPLAGRIRQAHQQLVLAPVSGLGAVVRHGPFEDPGQAGCSYLWDLDVYNEDTERFSADDLPALLRAANIFAAQTYESVLDPEYAKSRGLEHKDGTEDEA